ncbi:MAG: hypothetical protein WCO45_14850 [Pseudanabaena sp. ELA607]
MTIGNSGGALLLLSGSGDIIGQSFINDTSGTGASILLNDWTFGVIDGNFLAISSPATLKIFSGTGISGTEIGSATTYTSDGFGFTSTATWTFAGGLSLIDNQTYTAAVISSADLYFPSSDADPYANGYVTQSVSGNLTGSDTVFSANFSAGATAVPFEFETSSGLAILGGAWLLRRHLKNRTKKVKS